MKVRLWLDSDSCSLPFSVLSLIPLYHTELKRGGKVQGPTQETSSLARPGTLKRL